MGIEIQLTFNMKIKPYMQSIFTVVYPVIAALILSLAGVSFAHAQDAGSLLRDSQLPEQSLPSDTPSSRTPYVAPPAVRRGPFFKVTSIRFQGNTLIESSQFEELQQQAIGKAVSLADLENLAAVIDRLYFNQGYLSKTVIPEQDIGNGEVKLQIIEAKLGNIEIKKPEGGVRFDDSRVQAIVRDGQTSENALSVTELEDAMQVVTGMPGITAEARLVPSVTVEGTDIVIRMQNTDLVTNGLIFDNRGSRQSGQKRLVYSMVLNGPFAQGDQLNAIGVVTEGTRVINLTGSLPVNNQGARLSATASHLNYELDDQIDSEGTADLLSFQLSQPRLFSRNLNSFEQISFGVSHLQDEVLSIETSDKIIYSLSALTAGALVLSKEANSSLSYRASITAGDVDLSNNKLNQQVDALTVNTEGGFAKVNLSLNYNRSLGDATQVRVSTKSQLAFDNLDSSQKMSLGGMDGVRAYPTGEASGDTAFLIRNELHRQLSSTLSVYGFIDAGWTQLNNNTWSGWNGTNTDLDNEYALAGTGVGLTWTPNPQVSLNTILAHKIDNNPGADVFGNDGDGRNDDYRGWVELTMQF